MMTHYLSFWIAALNDHHIPNRISTLHTIHITNLELANQTHKLYTCTFLATIYTNGAATVPEKDRFIREQNAPIRRTLVLQSSGDGFLHLPATRTQRHDNVAAILARLAALGGEIVVPNKVRLLGTIRTGRTAGSGADAAGSRERDATAVSRAVAGIFTVGAVDERDIVPQGVGDAVLELRDAVGPEAGGVFGDLERGVPVEGLGESRAGANGGLVVCGSAPAKCVSKFSRKGSGVVYRTVKSWPQLLLIMAWPASAEATTL